ncbi:Flp family type IVb pilin [Aquibium carbonis]|nr:Flp family type IVb pilin [Aquibium carbonis]
MAANQGKVLPPMLIKFWINESGATAIEYGLIAAVLSLAIIGGIGNVYDAIEYLFGEPTSALSTTLN